MKRTLFYLYTALILLSRASAEANLIGNGNFQDSDRGIFGTIYMADWSTVGSSGSVHREFNYPSGLGNAIKLWYSDTSVYQAFPVAAGQSYEVSAYSYSSAFDYGGVSGWDGVAVVEWYNGDARIGTKISEDEIGRFCGGADTLDSWKLLRRTVTAPVSADSARIIFTLADNGISTKAGSIGWDNVDIEAVPEPAGLMLFAGGLPLLLLALPGRGRG